MAFLILVVTKLSETYVETVPFTVVYKNLPENHVITLDSTPQVNVTMSTHGFNLFSYYFYEPTYILDFESNITANDNVYQWLAEKGTYDLKQQLKKSIEVVSVKPDTLLLPFGVLSTKKVPVKLQSKVQFAPGYDALEGVKIIPDSVKIIGALEEISNIDAIETSAFDLKDVKTSIQQKVGLELENASGHLKLSENSITISADVEKFTEGIFEVPVVILNQPRDVQINYFPKHIKVAYNTSLKDYKSVKISDFKIECDYNDILTSQKTYFEPKLIINTDLVKSARMKQSKVDYIFEQ
ncbi:MAG: YbbR-like domain-containing protein [Algicola sp.]|nr:YbbR-like domain-containing protein [Algicola sp.]